MFIFRTLLLFVLIYHSPLNAESVQEELVISGIDIPSTITVAKSKPLLLNGVGKRYKLLSTLYVAALYLPSKANTTEQVVAMKGVKVLMLGMVFNTLSRSKLSNSWKSALEDNLSKDELKKLKTPLDKFYRLIFGVKEGDIVFFKFVPGSGTKITHNKRHIGTIKEPAFYPALLKMWIGKKPLDKGLKRDLLAQPNGILDKVFGIFK
jgi:hypothetical protein